MGLRWFVDKAPYRAGTVPGLVVFCPNGAQGDSPGQRPVGSNVAIESRPEGAEPQRRGNPFVRRTQGGASLCPGLSHFAPLGRGNKKPPPRGDCPRFLVIWHNSESGGTMAGKGYFDGYDSSRRTNRCCVTNCCHGRRCFIGRLPQIVGRRQPPRIPSFIVGCFREGIRGLKRRGLPPDRFFTSRHLC